MQKDPSNISPIKVIHEFGRQNQIPVEYQLENESGPAHAKLFTMQLRLGEKQYTGVGKSIKLAQRAAAQAAIDDQKVSLTKTNHQDDLLHKNPSQLATVVLNTWAARHHIPTQYVLLHQQILPSPMNVVWTDPHYIFYYRLSIGEKYFFDGHGSSINKARLDCATHAVNFLRQYQSQVIAEFPSATTERSSKSPVSLMYERAKQLGLSVQVEWEDRLTVTYRLGETYVATANGSNKQTAKLMAAEKMLEILPLPPENKPKTKCQQKRTNQHQKFVEQRGSVEYSLSHQINPITRLYQIGQARHIQIQFEELEKSTNDKLFRFRVRYDENNSAEGSGPNKQTAKRCAAENLLSQLNPELLESIVSPLTPSLPPAPKKGLLKQEKNTDEPAQEKKKHVHFREEEVKRVEKPADHSSSVTIKQQLIKACEKLNIHSQYDDQLIERETQQYQSILSLSIDDRLLAKFRGQGPSIRRAQENVSIAAWKNLQQLFNGSIPTPKPTTQTLSRRIETADEH